MPNRHRLRRRGKKFAFPVRLPDAAHRRGSARCNLPGAGAIAIATLS
jgi:hypothetical protein